jgi:hypothetical protein
LRPGRVVLALAGAALAVAAGAPASAEEDPPPAPPDAAPPEPDPAATPTSPVKRPAGEASTPGSDDVVVVRPPPVVATWPPGAFPDAPSVCLPPTPPCWHGSVALRGRLRTTEDERDSDAYAYLTLRYRDETTHGWSGSVFGRLAYDLDGGTDRDGGYAFDSVDDTFGSRWTARLYHAWAAYRPRSEVVEQVTAGRQWTEAGDGFTFDGVHATLWPAGREADLSVFVFGGVPAHLYEDAPEGDAIVGAGLSAAPWRGGDVRADLVWIDDETEVYGRERATLLSLEASHRTGPRSRARAWYRQLDLEPREVGASFDAYSARWDASLRAKARAQLIDENETVTDLDPYFAITQDLRPYGDAFLAGSKTLSPRVTVEAGAAARALFDGDDEGVYNREWARVFGTVVTTDWPARGWSLSGTVEWYGGDDEVTALGAAAEWRPSRRWRVAFGTDFSLWRVDLYADEERKESRGWYLRASHRPNDLWRFDLSVRLETDDDDEWLTATAGVRRDF